MSGEDSQPTVDGECRTATAIAVGDSQILVTYSEGAEDGVVWRRLGSGSYNLAYRTTSKNLGLVEGENPSGYWVLKIRKKEAAITDTPDRSIRLMRDVNPSFPVREYSFTLGEQACVGWIMPFVEGLEPSDKELAEAVVDVYRRTRRIVVDAFAPGNFIKTADGEVICVDVGAAKRRDSTVSEIYWNRAEERTQEQWRNIRSEGLFLQTVTCLETLEYLDSLKWIQTRWADDEVRKREVTKELIDALSVAKACHGEINPDILQPFLYLKKKGVLASRVNQRTERAPFEEACKFYEAARDLESLLQGNSDLVSKAQCVFDEVMVQAKKANAKKLSTLTAVLRETKELLTSPSKEQLKANLKKYRLRAKKISGKRSWGKRLGGAMLALLGVVIVAVSMAAMITTAGVGSVVGIPGIKLGTTIAAKGIALSVGVAASAPGSAALWCSRRRGVSKAMMRLADTDAASSESDHVSPGDPQLA